jgi:hypothetical protein
MARNTETLTVQHPAMLLAGSRPDVLVFRQQSGLFLTHAGTPCRVGLPGMADMGLIVATVITPDMVGRTVGVAVQAEAKTPAGRQSEAQVLWQRAVEQRGGVYRIVRSADDMRQLIADVQSGRAVQP